MKSRRTKTPRKQPTNLNKHDTQIWFRATTKTVAASLRNDNDRGMLAMYVDYLTARPKWEREKLRDRLITELRLACAEKFENNDQFITRAAVAAQEIFDLAEFLRTKVGPNDG